MSGPYGPTVPELPSDFRALLEREAYTDQPSQIMETRGAEHAAIVLQYLFHTARDVVRILTHKLSSDVYAKTGVRDAARAFLQRNMRARIMILVETELDLHSHPFVRDLQSSLDRIDIRICVGSEVEDHEFNFAIADDCSFRFEPSRGSARRALVGFRNAIIAQRMCAIFDAMWMKARVRELA